MNDGPLHDAPIPSISADRLKRRRFAERLSAAIAGYRDTESLVIALTGPWGSGKSSVLNMATELLTSEDLTPSQAPNEPPIIVRFNPWNFTTQQELITSFFRELRIGLGKGGNRMKQAAEALEMLETVLTPLGSLADFASLALPGLGAAKEGAKFLGSLAKKRADAAAKDLDTVRRTIDTNLKQAGRRIVVVIDDIDRLQPDEIRQIVKLVKQTAGFPYVVYLLAFDARVVAEALTDKRVDGKEYLEKIVQAEYQVPMPDPVLLKRELQTELQRVLTPHIRGNYSNERWRTLYFTTGMDELFTGLRPIRRFANGLAFRFQMLAHDVDLVDAIGLETIRLFAPDVYAAIPRNKDLFVSGYLPRAPGQDGSAVRKKLDAVFDAAPADVRDVVRRIALELFPAADIAASGGNLIQNEERLARENRLQSQHAFERYFLFGVAEGSVPPSDLTKILETPNPPAGTIGATVAQWAAEEALGDALWQIRTRDAPAHPSVVVPLAVALLNTMAERAPEDSSALTDAAGAALALLRLVIDADERRAQALQIVGDVRDAGMAAVFAHDATAEFWAQSPTSETPPLPDADVEAVQAAALERLRVVRDRLLDEPGLEVVLDGWRRWAPVEVGEVLAELADDDNQFVRIARTVLVRRGLGIGNRWVLRAHAGDYMDLDAAAQRSEQLRVSGAVGGEDADRLGFLVDLRRQRRLEDRLAVPRPPGLPEEAKQFLDRVWPIAPTWEAVELRAIVDAERGILLFLSACCTHDDPTDLVEDDVGEGVVFLTGGLPIEALPMLLTGCAGDRIQLGRFEVTADFPGRSVSEVGPAPIDTAVIAPTMRPFPAITFRASGGQGLEERLAPKTSAGVAAAAQALHFEDLTRRRLGIPVGNAYFPRFDVAAPLLARIDADAEVAGVRLRLHVHHALPDEMVLRYRLRNADGRWGRWRVVPTGSLEVSQTGRLRTLELRLPVPVAGAAGEAEIRHPWYVGLERPMAVAAFGASPNEPSASAGAGALL